MVAVVTVGAGVVVKAQATTAAAARRGTYDRHER
jgi:hypothetical protein